MDTRVGTRLAGGDDPESMSDAERTVRAIVELVHPLVRDGSYREVVDIAEEIIYPAGQWDEADQLDLKRLCEVFPMVLQRIGTTILATLATYMATTDGEHTLKHFLGEMEALVHLLSEAYETSLIEAFYIGLTKELDDELF